MDLTFEEIYNACREGVRQAVVGQPACEECGATEPNVWERTYWSATMLLCQWCWQKYASRD